MPRISWTATNHGSCEVIELLQKHVIRSRLSRWCACAAVSLSSLAGCQTTRELTDTVSPPWRATGDLMARAGTHVGESLESTFEPFSRRSTPTNVRAERTLANKVPTYPHSLTRNPGPTQSPTQIASQNGTNAPSTVELLAAPPAAQPATKNISPGGNNTPASRSEPQPFDDRDTKSLRPDSAPAPIAPTEPHQATAGSLSRDVTPAAAVANATNIPVMNASASIVAVTKAIVPNATWCRVRVRNVGSQAATQVSVSVTSPANATAKLYAADGGTTSPAAAGRMDFAPIAQVGPNEEVIITVGVVAADELSNRLRVQVRDALGGTNQDVQSRWKVTIEAADQP